MNREEVLNAVAEMSVIELSQLIKDMEEKFDVSASAAVAVAAPAAGEALQPAMRGRDRPGAAIKGVWELLLLVMMLVLLLHASYDGRGGCVSPPQVPYVRPVRAEALKGVDAQSLSYLTKKLVNLSVLLNQDTLADDRHYPSFGIAR